MLQVTQLENSHAYSILVTVGIQEIQLKDLKILNDKIIGNYNVTQLSTVPGRFFSNFFKAKEAQRVKLHVNSKLEK